MGHKLLRVVVGQGTLDDNGFLRGKLRNRCGGNVPIAGDHLNGLLLRSFQFFRQFGGSFRRGRAGLNKALARKVGNKRCGLLFGQRLFLGLGFLKYHAAK